MNDSTARGTKSGFSAEERAAMTERAEELRAEKRGAKRADAEAAVLEKIAEMPDADRNLAERIHAIVLDNAPELDAKLWYGMPAYARDKKIVCFFQAADKFDSRYATLGFNDTANLDDGTMWPTAFALTALDGSSEKVIADLVKRAVS